MTDDELDCASDCGGEEIRPGDWVQDLVLRPGGGVDDAATAAGPRFGVKRSIYLPARGGGKELVEIWKGMELETRDSSMTILAEPPRLDD